MVKVYAINSYGESPFSSYGEGGMILAKPDAPVNLKTDKTVNTDSQLSISWQEGLSNGGDAVTQYTVYCDQGRNAWVSVAQTGRILYYVTDFAVVAGKTYKFKVTATNFVGTSDFSEVIAVLAATVPDKPINLQFLPNDSNAYQVALKWESGAYDGGSPLLSYTILYSEGLSQMTVYMEDPEYWDDLYGTMQFIATGLTPGKSYRFAVQARNAIGLSKQSEILSVLAAQEPDAPTGLQNWASTTSGNTVGLQWASPSFDGGSAVIDFVVWAKSSSGDWKITQESVTTTNTVVYGLNQGEVYNFKVQARNALGTSSFSEPVAILTASIPDTPESPRTA